MRAREKLVTNKTPALGKTQPISLPHRFFCSQYLREALLVLTQSNFPGSSLAIYSTLHSTLVTSGCLHFLSTVCSITHPCYSWPLGLCTRPFLPLDLSSPLCTLPNLASLLPSANPYYFFHSWFKRSRLNRGKTESPVGKKPTINAGTVGLKAGWDQWFQLQWEVLTESHIL